MQNSFRKIGDLLDEKNTPLFNLNVNTEISLAIKEMLQRNYSQIPVTKGKKVVGVLSYRSIVEHLHKINFDLKNFGKMQIYGVMENPEFIDHDSSIHKTKEKLLNKDYVLIGEKNNTRGIATVSDAMFYFYRVSSAFILLGEIELAIRHIISIALQTMNKMNECISRCMKSSPKEFTKLISFLLNESIESLTKSMSSNFDEVLNKIKSVLKERKDEVSEILNQLTFNNYQSIITRSDNWNQYFKGIFQNKKIIQLNLERVNHIRNEIFHFRIKELSLRDYNDLVSFREELFRILEVYE